MKLFHKFLLSLILISILPLVIFSLIILNTTAIKLKRVIDEGNANTLASVTLEVNKFFVEIEKKLDIARKIEESNNMSIYQQSEMLFQGISDNKLLTDIYLMDKNFKILNGMSINQAESANASRNILEKADTENQVQISSIAYSDQGRPYIDVVYPINTTSKEFLYMRVRLNFLLNRISLHLQEHGNKKKSTKIILVDREGAAASAPDLHISPFSFNEVIKFMERPQSITFEKNGRINLYNLSKGPEWLIIFQQPVWDAYREIYSIKIWAALWTIIAFLGAVIGALMLAKNLTRPITLLINGIENIAIGNLDYKVQKVSNDELSRLAVVFNSMVVKLKKLQDEVKRSERLATIGQTANILGHEIRNPLAAITNATYLIKMELTKKPDTNPKLFKRIEIIESEIKSTNKIINDMLDYSRSRQPVLTIQSINHVVKLITDEQKLPENIKLESAYGDVPQISIDVDEIKQVLRNLINNAIDAMVQNGGVLTIRTFNGVDSVNRKSYVCIDLVDTGMGMSSEVQARIFEPFYSTKSKGTGLGLAVVKRIIEERHKGNISVESERGRGTTFHIELPA